MTKGKELWLKELKYMATYKDKTGKSKICFTERKTIAAAKREFKRRHPKSKVTGWGEY